ncbi:MAG: Leu/Phe/Val dehydrogenase [Myxococcota bacterium]
MDLFDYAEELDYGELHFRVNPKTGLRAIVALHNLQLGPAIGGCRFIEYDSTDAAVKDAMRLARGMTYKAAITDLPHGGGKSVLMRPKNLTEEQRTAIFQEFGAFIDGLNGQYITAEDSGTKVADMDLIHEQTEHVLGYSADEGGSGDPSPVTARGVLHGIEAAAKFRYDRDNLEGLTIAIQGVGNVGRHLAGDLHERGAELIITDVNKDAVNHCVSAFGAEAVEPDAIFGVDCDIFAPCALGSAINDDTLPQLRCDIVAGAANNQLAEARHGEALRARDILYAPDYAINAGGLIFVAASRAGDSSDFSRRKTEGIYDTMLAIFERADRESLPTNVIANRIVEEKLDIG